jgi:hypothetical protein
MTAQLLLIETPARQHCARSLASKILHEDHFIERRFMQACTTVSTSILPTQVGAQGQ